MRASLTLLLTLIASPLAHAQATQPQQPVVITRDGGTSGRMESIVVPPKAGAPFTLTLATEWSRPLANGGNFTLVNQRRIARDGRGRIYQERWVLVPKGSNIKSFMDVLQITDPAEHTWYNCGTRQKLCELLPYGGSNDKVYRPAIGATGPINNGNGFHQHEELGVSSTAGVNTTGYRETTTINAGVFGNDRLMVTTREFWYSSELGINLISTIDDPQTGKQLFTVKDLTTSEPDPQLFVVPEGYKIVDRRKDESN